MTNFSFTKKVGLVGPCTAGKSTLASFLIPMGFQVREIAQEHSYIPEMWKLIANPDILIFLDVSFETSLIRKKLNWNFNDFLEQQNRLKHSRENADLVINTDTLNPEQVLEVTLEFLKPFLNDQNH